MAAAGEAGRGRVLAAIALGSAILLVAWIGQLVAPRLDDLMFVATAGTVATIVGLGTTWLVRYTSGLAILGHAHALTAWLPPAAWFLATLFAARLLAVDDAVLAASGATVVLGVLLLAQQREYSLPIGGQRAAEFLVNLAVFVSAFALFAMLRELRFVGVSGAMLVAAIAALVALVPLRRGLAGARRTAVHGLLVGTVVGQTAWALGYWTLPPVVFGAALLLLLYVLVGLCESMLDRTFSRRLLAEYSAVGLCGLAVIVGIGPWRA